MQTGFVSPIGMDRDAVLARAEALGFVDFEAILGALADGDHGTAGGDAANGPVGDEGVGGASR